jgi:hypothetical protein
LHLLAGFELAHGWPIQFQPIGIVDNAIEDSVGEGWFAEDRRVPLFLIGWCLTPQLQTHAIFYLTSELRSSAIALAAALAM